MDLCARRLKNVRQINFQNEPTAEEMVVALVTQ